MLAQDLAVLIPLAPFMLGGFAIWTRHNRQVETIRATAASDAASQYVAHTERLEERVRVLERIITDRGTSLAHEIESLRGIDSASVIDKKLQ
ncbi:hypothetical protein [Novosphingobium sp.]|uniref:hypothetical protein n=1 Tax=Novosphingobium sp. TaxID=1874826 RepID=UPI003B525322